MKGSWRASKSGEPIDDASEMKTMTLSSLPSLTAVNTNVENNKNTNTLGKKNSENMTVWQPYPDNHQVIKHIGDVIFGWYHRYLSRQDPCIG